MPTSRPLPEPPAFAPEGAASPSWSAEEEQALLTTVNEELRRRNRELGELNADLSNLFTSVDVAIVMLDESLRVRRFTPRAAQVMSLIPTDAGRPLTDLRPCLAMPDLEARLRHVVETGGSVDEDVRDTFGRWHQLRLRPYRTADGRLAGVVLALADIDALKARERELAEAQEIAHVGSWRWELGRNTVEWSDEMYRIYGLPLREMPITFESFIERVHADDREAVVRQVREALEAGRPFSFDHRIVRPDGSERTLHARGEVLFDGSKRAIGMLGTGQDITARVQIERALRETRDLLEQRVVERTAQLSVANAELRTEVEERTRVEAALRESEGLFRAMADTAPVMLWVTGPEGHGTFFSKPWLEFRGRALEQEVEDGWTEGVHPDDIAAMTRTRQASIEAQRPFQLEYRLRRADGAYRWVLEHGLPRFTSARQFIGFIGSCVDITERREAEAARARLAAIVDDADDAIIGKTLDGVVVSWNRAAERIYGYTEAEMIGQSILRVVPPELHERVRELHRQVTLGESVHIELERLRKDGRRVIVSLSLSPVRDADGRIIMTSSIARDMTAQREAAMMLTRTERELRDFIENATVGLHWVGHDGKILWANKAELAMLGYMAEEYVGRSIMDFHADQAVIDDILARLREGQELDNYEARMRCKDGSIRHVMIDSNVFWEEGRFIHTRCFTRDITERKRAEEQLHASLREKEVLLKEIHHRVKNNLQIISSLLSLQADQLSEPRILSMFRESQNRIRSMALIHEKLYSSQDFSKIDMPTYIHSLMEQLFRSYAVGSAITPALEVEQVQLDIDLAIPCGLLLNELVSNALEHGFPDGREGTLRVTLRRLHDGADRLELIVQDDGIGLPEGLDLHAMASLGLRLVTALTEQLGGSLQLTRNHGSTFRISFPTRSLEKPALGQ